MTKRDLVRQSKVKPDPAKSIMGNKTEGTYPNYIEDKKLSKELINKVAGRFPNYPNLSVPRQKDWLKFWNANHRGV